jgi:hypothetical protein
VTDSYQVVLGALAVVIMVMVPIGCVLLWDLLAGRWDESISRFRERQIMSAEHRRTLRALRQIQACSMLEIEHELRDDTTGFERDIERFRVEAELERAGVTVTDGDFGQAA